MVCSGGYCRPWPGAVEGVAELDPAAVFFEGVNGAPSTAVRIGFVDVSGAPQV